MIDVEDIVTFDIARWFRELGYSDPTNHYYTHNGSLYESTKDDYNESPYENFNEEDYKDYRYSAPTLAEAIKWLRKYKRIYVIPEFVCPNMWRCEVRSYTDDGMIISDLSFEIPDKVPYEIAILNGLLKLKDLIKGE